MHRNVTSTPEAFLEMVAPHREDLVVSAECCLPDIGSRMSARPERPHPSLLATRPYFRYSVGTTNMFSSVDVVNPQRITIAIGV